MMSDNISHSGAARKLGRGFVRLLTGLFGRNNMRKARESVDVLAEEFRAGKREAEAAGEKPPPRRIEHRELNSEELPPSS